MSPIFWRYALASSSLHRLFTLIIDSPNLLKVSVSNSSNALGSHICFLDHRLPPRNIRILLAIVSRLLPNAAPYLSQASRYLRGGGGDCVGVFGCGGDSGEKRKGPDFCGGPCGE